MMTTRSSPLEHALRSEEDDSAFISAADFFSLISLTLLYVMIAYAPTSATGTVETPVVTFASESQDVLAQKDMAHVQFVRSDSGFVIRVLRPYSDKPKQREVALDADQIRLAQDWVEETVTALPLPTRVIFYLDDEEQRPEVHKSFNQMLRSVQRRFPVSQAFPAEQAFQIRR